MVSPVCAAAFPTACALSAIVPAVVASSSIVVDVSATAEDCSAVTAAAFLAASRSSPETSPRTAEVERRRPRSSFRRPTVAVSSLSRSKERSSSRNANSAKAATATTATRPVITPTVSVRVFAEAAAASLCRARCVWVAVSWPSGRRTLGSAADSRETALLSRAAVVPAAPRSWVNRARVPVVRRRGLQAEPRLQGSLSLAERGRGRREPCSLRGDLTQDRWRRGGNILAHRFALAPEDANEPFGQPLVVARVERHCRPGQGILEEPHAHPDQRGYHDDNRQAQRRDTARWPRSAALSASTPALRSF